MIVVAAFESPAVIAGLDDVTVMGQPVEQRSRHLGVAEHTGPFSEREIGGDDDGGALVEPADEMEQKLPDWALPRLQDTSRPLMRPTPSRPAGGAKLLGTICRSIYLTVCLQLPS